MNVVKLMVPPLLAGALSGCSGGGTGGNPDGGTARPDMYGPAISGTLALTFHDDQDQSTVVPYDATGFSFAALFPDGKGGFATYAGQGATDGSFLVPGLPANVLDGKTYYYLVLGVSGGGASPTYIVSNSAQLDLGYDLLGRPDATPVTQSTVLTLNLTGLTAWDTTDYLELFSSGADVYIADLTGGNGLSAGATGTGGLKVDYLSLGGNYAADIIDGSKKGDVAYLTQLAAATSSTALSFKGVTKALQLPATFTLVDGTPQTLSGALQAVPQSETVSVQWNTADFEALKSELNPNVVPDKHVLEMLAQPGGLSYVADSAADLLYGYAKTGAGNVMTGALTYGNPYPASWGEFGYASFSYTLDYKLPQTTTPATVKMLVDYEDTRQGFMGGPLTPRVGPVQSPQLGGKSALAPLTGVGLTPTLTFGAPSVGAPTSYDISVYQLASTVSSQTVVQPIGVIYTTQSSVQIPPGLFSSGGTYVLGIRTRLEPNTMTPGSRPFRSTLPSSTATTFTAMFSP